jgi:hypothetical protein
LRCSISDTNGPGPRRFRAGRSALVSFVLAPAAGRGVVRLHALEHQIDEHGAERASGEAGRDVTADDAADREGDAEEHGDDGHVDACHGVHDARPVPAPSTNG